MVAHFLKPFVDNNATEVRTNACTYLSTYVDVLFGIRFV